MKQHYTCPKCGDSSDDDLYPCERCERAAMTPAQRRQLRYSEAMDALESGHDVDMTAY